VAAVRAKPIPTPVRRMWQRILNLRYRWRRNRDGERSVLERVGGVDLVITPNVFNPRLCFTGEFLARCLRDDPPFARSYVLDLGTGSGIGSIVAAKYGAVVDAVDVNSDAVECARVNAILNRVVDRITFHHGDLFDPVRTRRFHRVLFNPPFIRGDPTSAFDGAWRSPDIAERFARELAEHLTPDGVAWLVLSSVGDERGFLDALTTAGFDVTCTRTSDRVNEVLTLHEARVR
jgi:HemK-related putative methylase